MSKITKASQIIEAMIFLGIDPINFKSMREQHGGLDGLFNHVSSLLS